MASQALKQMVADQLAEKAKVEVLFIHGMRNKTPRVGKFGMFDNKTSQLLEELKDQHKEYLSNMGVQTTFITLKDYMKKNKIAKGKDDETNVNNIVKKLGGKATEKKKKILFIDEFQLQESDDDYTVLPSLEPEDDNTSVISCFRPLNKQYIQHGSTNTQTNKPRSIHLDLPASFRQCKGLRKNVEPLLKEVFGYSLLQGVTEMLKEDSSTLPSVTWANFEVYDQAAVVRKLTQVRREDTRECALIDMAYFDLRLLLPVLV